MMYQHHATASTVEFPLLSTEPDVAPSGDTIRFPGGLPGFEMCRTFVLMVPESSGPLQCLKALDGPSASFLVIDPRRALADYRCELSDADRLALRASDERELVWLALVSVDLDGTITANLRAPIVINPARMIGRQVVPHNGVYPLRHVLVGAE